MGLSFPPPVATISFSLALWLTWEEIYTKDFNYPSECQNRLDTSDSDSWASCGPQPPATSNSESVTLELHQECRCLTSFPDHDIQPDIGTRELGLDSLKKNQDFTSSRDPQPASEKVSRASFNSWPLNRSGFQ